MMTPSTMLTLKPKWNNKNELVYDYNDDGDYKNELVYDYNDDGDYKNELVYDYNDDGGDDDDDCEHSKLN